MSRVQNLTRPRFFQFSEVKKTSFARASAHLPPAETFLGYARFGNAKTKYFSNKVHGWKTNVSRNVLSRTRSFDYSLNNIFLHPRKLFSFSFFLSQLDLTNSLLLFLRFQFSFHIRVIFPSDRRSHCDTLANISKIYRKLLFPQQLFRWQGFTFAVKLRWPRSLIHICRAQTIRQIMLSKWIKLLQKAHILQNVSIKYLPWNGRSSQVPRHRVTSYDFALLYQNAATPRAVDTLMKIRAHLCRVLTASIKHR